VLRPKGGLLKKLVDYDPRTHIEEVRQALFDAGAGAIGDYDQCSYNTAGYGTFRPLDGANPAIGQVGEQERVEETKIEVIYAAQDERKLVVLMPVAYQYEEVAHQIFNIENSSSYVGSAVIGNLEEPLAASDFLAYLKARMNLHVTRQTKPLAQQISRV